MPVRRSVRPLALVLAVAAAGPLAVSCKQRTYNDAKGSSYDPAGRSPRWMVQSFYNSRKIVGNEDESFFRDPDAARDGKALIHYNSDDKEKAAPYRYLPGTLESKVARFENVLKQSSRTPVNEALDGSLASFRSAVARVEGFASRYVGVGQSATEGVVAACANFGISSKEALQDAKFSGSIRGDLGGASGYLKAVADASLDGGVRLTQVRESFVGKGANLPFVAWLDESMEPAILKGDREATLVQVARVPDAVRLAWLDAFKTAGGFDDPAKFGFGKLVGVVFPDGRIAVGAPTLRAGGNAGEPKPASPAHVLEAACGKLLAGQCKALSEQPFLAAVEFTFDADTGVITDIRDVHRVPKARDAGKSYEWGAALEAALLVHGLALHNEVKNAKFPSDTKPVDCDKL